MVLKVFRLSFGVGPVAANVLSTTSILPFAVGLLCYGAPLGGSWVVGGAPYGIGGDVSGESVSGQRLTLRVSRLLFAFAVTTGLSFA